MQDDVDVGTNDAQRKQSLFRPEVLEKRSNPWLGEVSLAQPVPRRTFITLSSLAVVAVAIFLGTVASTGRVHLTGKVAPIGGLTIVASPVAGVVVRREVEDGERVTLGEALVEISSSLSTFRGTVSGEVAGTLELRRAELTSAIEAASLARLEEDSDILEKERLLHEEVETIQTEILDSARRLQLALDSAERFRKLKHEKLVSVVEANRYESEVLQRKSELSSVVRQRSNLRRSLNEIDRERRAGQMSSNANISELKMRAYALQQESVQNAANGGAVVTATADGTATAIAVEPGQSVKQGDPLLTILPDGAALRVEFFVESRSMAHLSVGDKVALSFEAFPYQTHGLYTGWVEQVSSAPYPNSESDDSYRVFVSLKENVLRKGEMAYKLQPGMAVDGYVTTEKETMLAKLTLPARRLLGRLW